MGLARHGVWDGNKRENKMGRNGKRNGVSIRGEHIRRVKIFYFLELSPTPVAVFLVLMRTKGFFFLPLFLQFYFPLVLQGFFPFL